MTDEAQQSQVTCVLTRMRFRRGRDLRRARRAHRRLSRVAEQRRPPGLLKAVLVTEDRRTCFSVSVWAGEPKFSASVREHIGVVNTMLGRLEQSADGLPELWSTTWRLAAMGRNRRWDDLVLPDIAAGHEPGGPYEGGGHDHGGTRTGARGGDRTPHLA